MFEPVFKFSPSIASTVPPAMGPFRGDKPLSTGFLKFIQLIQKMNIQLIQTILFITKNENLYEKKASIYYCDNAETKHSHGKIKRN